MKYYDVAVRAIVIKTIRVLAVDSQAATEEAHRRFTTYNDDTAESYEQDTVYISAGNDLNPCYVEWEDIKRDCQFDADDNNNGQVFGIHWEDENGQIIDAEWFETAEKRDKYAKL